MIFYINNQNGTGYRYPNKESFLDDLSALIDELTKEGATYFDMSFETDAKNSIQWLFPEQLEKLMSEKGDSHD